MFTRQKIMGWKSGRDFARPSKKPQEEKDKLINDFIWSF